MFRKTTSQPIATAGCEIVGHGVLLFGYAFAIILPKLLQGGDSVKINEKILTLRKKLGWSQDELAEKLSVSRQSVSKWETGDSVPESAKLPEIAKIFSVSTDYLLDDSKEEFLPPQEEESNNTADKIMSKGESAFKNYGWILGVVLILFGLYRIACVVSIFSFFLQGGVVGVAGLIGSPVILPTVFSALVGLTFVACGIIMIKRLRKNKK